MPPKSNDGGEGESVVLEEDFDPNYEPSLAEVEEYAGFLGWSQEEEAERKLLWIARDGLKAVLPKCWKPCQTDDGDIYYFNFESGDSKWEHPCDEQFKGIWAKERSKLKLLGDKYVGKPLVEGAKNELVIERTQVETLSSPSKALSRSAAAVLGNLPSSDPIGKPPLVPVARDAPERFERPVTRRGLDAVPDGPVRAVPLPSTEELETDVSRGDILVPTAEEEEDEDEEDLQVFREMHKENMELIRQTHDEEMRSVRKTHNQSIETLKSKLKDALQAEERAVEQKLHKEKLTLQSRFKTTLEEYRQQLEREQQERKREIAIEVQQATETLARELRENMDREVEELKKKMGREREQVQGMEKELARAKRTMEKEHAQILEEIRGRYKKEIRAGEDAHRGSVKELVAKQMEETRALREEHEKRLEEERQKGAEEKRAAWAQSLKAKCGDLEARLAEALERTRAGFRDKEAAARRLHEQALQRAEEENAAALAASEERLSALRAREADALQADRKQLERGLGDRKRALRQEYERKFETLKSLMEKDLEAREHELRLSKERMETEAAACKSRLERVREEYAGDLEDLRASHRRTLAGLKQRQEQELADRAREHQERRQALSERLQSEQRSLTEDFAGRRRVAKKQRDEFVEQQEALQREAQSLAEERLEMEEKRGRFERELHGLEGAVEDRRAELRSLRRAEPLPSPLDRQPISVDLSVTNEQLLGHAEERSPALLGPQRLPGRRQQQVESTEAKAIHAELEKMRREIAMLRSQSTSNIQAAGGPTTAERPGWASQRSLNPEPVAPPRSPPLEAWTYSKFSIPSSKHDWLQWLDAEKKEVTSAKSSISKRKSRIRSKQAKLKADQEAWTCDHHKIKTLDKNKYGPVISVHSWRKKMLDTQIVDINTQISELKEQQQLVKQREQKIQQFELELFKAQIGGR